jgi:hypothetical protein
MWVDSPQLVALSKFSIRSPSFPHALSGGSTGLTTGGFGTGPPIKTFGGDAFKNKSHRRVLIPRRLLRGYSFVFDANWIVRHACNDRVVSVRLTCHTSLPGCEPHGRSSPTKPGHS